MKLLLFLLLIFLPFNSAKELIKIDLHKRTLSHTDLHNSAPNPNSCLLIQNTVVQVDLEPNAANSNNTYSSSEVLLAIGLSSNETGFADLSGIFSITDSVCDIVSCTEENTTLQFNTPWIQTPAKRIHLDKAILIAGGAWQLKTSALYFDFIISQWSATVVAPKGWIGLGTDSESKHNFRDNNPIFSILINEAFNGAGSLIFGFDPSIADIDNPLMVVRSDANWKMNMISLSFGSVVHFNDSQILPVMFNLMTDGIILPETILNSLLQQMRTENISCPFYECYADDLTGLPSLVFGLSDGKNISLRPDDYMKKADSNFDRKYISLLFKRNKNPLYYEDHVVLGWDVLAKFYTLFQQKDGVNTISFYEIDSATQVNSSTSESPSIDSLNSNSTSSLLITKTIFVIVLLCVGVIMFIVNKKKAKIETETTELSKIEASSSSVDPQEQSHFL